MGEKNKLNKILVILAIILAIAMAYFVFFPAGQGNTAPDGQNLVWEIVTTGTTGNGDVEIALTPLSFNSGQLKVQISANTHSVELEQFDLKENTELLYEDKTLNPTTAPKLSGHHSSGILVFDTSEISKPSGISDSAQKSKTGGKVFDINKGLNKFNITISGIPKLEKRVFLW